MKLDLILRIGAFSCFLGHGVLAIKGNPKYIELLESFGFTEGSALIILTIVGSVDIVVATLVLLKPKKAVLFWAIGWTVLTIGAWAIKEASFWDFMRRVNYTITPLALLIYLLQQKVNRDDDGQDEIKDEEKDLTLSSDIIHLDTFDDNIRNLDLSKIKMKLMQLEEGEGWTKEMCDEAEIEYRRFLQLVLLYPTAKIVPNRAIDIIWHYHILDTEAYHNDCHCIFGFFMHHYPYYGMNGAADEVRLLSSFDETGILYEKTFGLSMDRPDFLQSFNNNHRDLEILIG
jgi:uncharacterized membrane protein YphA (DoxX/SURF4 family)